MPASCGGCTPYLLIEAATGVSIDVYSGTNLLVHSASRQARLQCNQYRGRDSFVFVLRPTIQGQPVEFNLRVAWLFPSYINCNYERLFAPNVLFPFTLGSSIRPPGWGDPDPIRPSDFSTDALGRILKPQRLGFNWPSSAKFDLAAVIPGGESFLLRLVDASGSILGELTTAGPDPRRRPSAALVRW